MKFATMAFSFVACVASVATLGVVLVGAKQVRQEMDDVKTKTNSTVSKLKDAIMNLEV